jgi:hypothetical protein
MQHDSLLSSNAKFLKVNDYYKFSSTLFAPFQVREKLITLYTFEVEISQIYFKTKDQMIREIRYKWWEEAIDLAIKNGPIKAPLIKHLMEQEINLSNLIEIVDFHKKISVAGYCKNFNDIDRLFNEQTNCFEIAAHILSGNSSSQKAKIIYKACFLISLIINFPSVINDSYLKPITLQQINQHSYQVDKYKKEENIAKLKTILKEVLSYIENDINQSLQNKNQDLPLPILKNLVWAQQYIKLIKSNNYNPIEPSTLNKPWYLIKLLFS